MHCDTASSRIARPAADVFEFVANPENLNRWTFGTWTTRIDATGLVRGTSIKDGSVIYVRIAPRPDLNFVDYLIGKDPKKLSPRIFIRIAEGELFGGHERECVLMMTAVRAVGMSDEGWQDLKATHAFEVSLVKAAVETGYDHRADRQSTKGD